MATEMNQSARTIRWGFVLVALAVSLVTLLSQTGAFKLPCDEYCARIRDWTLSPVISILTIAGFMAIAYSLKNNDERLFRNLTLVGLVIAITLQALAFSWQGVCALCMGLAFIVLGLAITAIPKVAWSYAALLPALFGLVVIYDEFAPSSAREPERIAYRPYESPPGEREHGYIVYIDPEDNASRLLIANTNEAARPDIIVYYRWRLNPETKERSMLSVVAIETVNSERPEVAPLFRRAVLTMSSPRTDQNIIEIARRFNVVDIVASALKSQSADIASFLKADQKEYESSDQNELPAVLMVSPHDRYRANPASTALLVNMGDSNLMQEATSPNGGN